LIIAGESAVRFVHRTDFKTGRRPNEGVALFLAI
jgi:hypothetical protein